jgi:hypothetical protein
MDQIISIILVLIIVLSVATFFDRWQSKEFRAINQKISADPNYLNDPEKRDLCVKLLRQTLPRGFYSIYEIRKLKKSLDRYTQF